MSDPAFLLWPDKRLKAVAAPVERVGAEEAEIWARMERLMYAMPGVGLAAPQIGILRRLIVVDASDDGRAPVRLANPELLETSEELRPHEEASPNLPGVHARVMRPARVRVAYLDETGAEAEREFEGLWATSVQHQIDHLNGMLYPDRLKPVKRRMVLDKFTKLQRRG